MMCLHLPVKLLLLRHDPKMLYQTRTKRETGVPCLTAGAGGCQPPPALLGGGQTPVSAPTSKRYLQTLQP